MLRDGRALTFSSLGPRDGLPVLHFHGAIGSPRWHAPELHEVVGRLGIRYLALSRPGFGGSDPQPGRTVADFAVDVEEVVSSLGLQRPAVVGVSAGAPYALACAHRFGHALAGVAAVSSQAPGHPLHGPRGSAFRYRMALALLHAAPRTSGAAANAALDVVRRHPDLLARGISRGACPADRPALAREAGGIAERTLAAFGAGAGAMIDDYLTCCADWGFDPGQIEVPVHLWHGERDPVVPLAHAQMLAAGVPLAELTVEPGGGHFIFSRRLPDIIGRLVRDESPREDTREVQLAA
jgi:pimeloyl-ACP methyl ester carboxylesterase